MSSVQDDSCNGHIVVRKGSNPVDINSLQAGNYVRVEKRSNHPPPPPELTYSRGYLYENLKKKIK